MTLPITLKKLVSDLALQENQNADFWRPLAIRHGMLSLEYSVFCSKLIHKLPNLTIDEQKNEIIAAYKMADLLIHLYRDYLNVSHEVQRLYEEQDCYRAYLLKLNVECPGITDAPESGKSTSQFIRVTTATLNFHRLVFIRTKKVLNAIEPMVEQAKHYAQFIKLMDKYANPFLNHLSWIFFLPRLVNNLFLVLKHLVPGSWMSEEEKSLGWPTRLLIQLQRRWFEIGNDLIWCLAGLLNCFLWLGPLMPLGVTINVVLYGYDVVLAGIRAGIEYYRLRALKTVYEQEMEGLKPGPERDELAASLKHLNERISYEMKRLLLAIINTSALLVAIIVCFPLFAVSPIVPLVGACLLLSITLAVYVAAWYIDKSKPQDKLAPILSKQGFFSKPDEPSDHAENEDLTYCNSSG